MYVIFDGRSSTETGYDYVRFYKDDSHDAFYGENKYHGRRRDHNFPGVGERPPLRIPSNSFVIHFSSDSANHYWGYKFVACPTYEGSVWQNLRFDPSDECLALADRLMESSAQLKEAALSAQNLLAAIDLRNTTVANRLIDWGARLDAESQSNFIGGDSDGALQKLLLDPSDESVALANRLMESYPAFKEAAASEQTLLAALIALNAPAANRSMALGACLDDNTRSKFIGSGGDGAWRKLLFNTNESCIALADRLMESYPAFKEAAASSQTLLSALIARNAPAANRSMALGACLDDNTRSKLIGSGGDGAWRKLLFDTNKSCIALTDRLMESYQALKDAAVSPQTLLVALDARDTVVANRLMDLGACLDDKTRSKFVGSGGDSAWRTLLFDTHGSCIALADRLMESSAQLKEAALSPPMLLAALDARSTRAANRLMDLGAAIDAAAALHLRNMLEPMGRVAAPLAFEEALELPGAIVRESAHPYPDNANTFEHIRCLAVSVVS